MKHATLLTAVAGCAILALAGCSSNRSDGTPPPRATTIIEPPQSSPTATPGYSNTDQ